MPAPNNRKCQVEDCGRKHHAHNYCEKHNRQVKTHGHILTSNYLSEQGKKARAKSSGSKGTHWSEEAKQKFSESSGGVRKNTGRTHFEKGFTPWNKGKKGLVVGWNKGKKLSLETRLKISQSRQGKYTGEQNHAYKGFTTEFNRRERVRFNKYHQPKVFARDNYTCQMCDQYSGNLQVDHIKSWAKYPELRFELDNCRTLCMACHYYVTFKRKMPKGTIWGHNLSRRIV